MGDGFNQVTRLVQAQLPQAVAAGQFNGYGMGGQYGAQHPSMLTAATAVAAQILGGGFPVRARLPVSSVWLYVSGWQRTMFWQLRCGGNCVGCVSMRAT
jgi:hypothetical protein